MPSITDLLNLGGLLKDIRTAITGKEPLDANKQLEFETKLREAEAQVISASSSIITAEAKSEHWITSTWRPLTMITFTFIIANNYVLVPYIHSLFNFEIPTLELTESMWDLLKWGMGGYVIGRSAEKAVKSYSTAMRDKDIAVAHIATNSIHKPSAMDILNENTEDEY